MFKYPMLKNCYTLHFFCECCYLFREYNSFVEMNEAHCFLLSLCTGSNTFFDIVDIAYKEFGKTVPIDKFEYFITETFVKYSNKGILIEGLGRDARSSCVSGRKGSCFPYFVSIELCNYCNLGCGFCYMNCTKKGCNIPIDVIDFFINNYDGLTKNVQLSGGEPTLHKNFSEIALKITSKFNTSLITNGTQLYKVDPIILKKFKLIQLSIYGCDKRTYSLFTGSDFAYEQLEKGLISLEKNKISDVVVSITITKYNYDLIEKYLKFIKEFGISRVRFSVVSDFYNYSPYKFNNSVLKDIDLKVKEIAKKYDINIPIFELEKFNNKGTVKFNCGAGKFSFIVGAKGLIRPCNLITDSVFEKTNIFSHTEALKKGNLITYDYELSKTEKALNLNGKSFRNIKCLGLGG